MNTILIGLGLMTIVVIVHDDLEFYLDEEGGVVHFRSASRIGYSDLGMNRQRYHVLMELYSQLPEKPKVSKVS